MKRLLMLLAVSGSLLMLVPAVHAAGLNLSWGDCGSAGTTDATSACAVNTGSVNLYLSVVAPAGLTSVTGEEGVIDFIFSGGTVPAWWQAVTAGSCRGTGLAVNYNTAGATCNDYFNTAGSPLGGFGYDWGALNTTPSYNNPVLRTDTARIRTVSAIDGAVAGPMAEGTEYYIANVNIKFTKTTGVGFCDGCLVPVCIQANSVNLTQGVGLGDHLISGAVAGGHDFATWQGGAGANCAVVPVRKTSWGQIKSLYR